MSEPVDYTSDFDPVQAAEREWLARRRQASNLPAPGEIASAWRFPVAVHRSATFNLGVLQALEGGGMLRHVDYLSSVSGGGYAASCYTWLRARLAAQTGMFSARLVDSAGNVLDWLRAHGKYLISHRGFSIWTLIASILAATFINVLVLGPPLLFAVYALTLAWLPVEWPHWLVLPGAHVPQGHHGYWLLLALGVACLALFPFIATVFAVVAGIPHLADVRRVDKLRVFMGRLLSIGPALIALGLIPVGNALVKWPSTFRDAPCMQSVARVVACAAALGDCIDGVTVSRAAITAETDDDRLSLVVYGLLIFCYLVSVSGDLLSPLFLGLAMLAVVLAFACDINRLSIHAYYRARLSDAFLPNVESTGAQEDPGNFRLSELGPERAAPLHLINTTLNTTSSRNERMRSREGASFFFSPIYTGSSATGWRRIDTYAGGAITLSNAFTISGAAIDPDMVATRARAVSFLMALLNVRLGYWARNPKFGHLRDPLRPWWWVFIAREMLGLGLDETRRHVHLSDGGGFENLGMYELIRRRVRYLIVTDVGADPRTTLGDLGQAIERVRVDFGAEINLAADRLYHERDQDLMQQPYVLAVSATRKAVADNSCTSNRCCVPD